LPWNICGAEIEWTLFQGSFGLDLNIFCWRFLICGSFHFLGSGSLLEVAGLNPFGFELFIDAA